MRRTGGNTSLTPTVCNGLLEIPPGPDLPDLGDPIDPAQYDLTTDPPAFGDLTNSLLANVGTPADGFDQVFIDGLQVLQALSDALDSLGSQLLESFGVWLGSEWSPDTFANDLVDYANTQPAAEVIYQKAADLVGAVTPPPPPPPPPPAGTANGPCAGSGATSGSAYAGLYKVGAPDQPFTLRLVSDRTQPAVQVASVQVEFGAPVFDQVTLRPGGTIGAGSATDVALVLHPQQLGTWHALVFVTLSDGLQVSLCVATDITAAGPGAGGSGFGGVVVFQLPPPGGGGDGDGGDGCCTFEF